MIDEQLRRSIAPGAAPMSAASGTGGSQRFAFFPWTHTHPHTRDIYCLVKLCRRDLLAGKLSFISIFLFSDRWNPAGSFMLRLLFCCSA